MQFQPIAAVETTPVNSVIDIVGVVETVGEYMDITLKNGSATHKRSVHLKDQSNASIEVRTPAVYRYKSSKSIMPQPELHDAPISHSMQCKAAGFSRHLHAPAQTSLPSARH